MDKTTDPKIIQSVFLLLLAMSGAYIDNIFGCQAQYIIKTNVFAKHLILLFIIYFTVTYSGDNDDEEYDPLEFLKSSIIIWILYTLFIRQNLDFTIISGLLLMATYVLDGYVKKYEKKGDDEKKEKMLKYKKIALYSSVGSIILGSSIYFIDKKNEYKDNFDFYKFIFGTVVCDSMKNL